MIRLSSSGMVSVYLVVTNLSILVSSCLKLLDMGWLEQVMMDIELLINDIKREMKRCMYCRKDRCEV